MEISGVNYKNYKEDGRHSLVKTKKEGYDLEPNVRKVKDNISLDQIKGAIKQNNMDEIVFENSKGRFIVSESKIEIKGKFGLPKFGLPAVGENINFGSYSGKVILTDDEHTNYNNKDEEDSAKQRIRDIVVKTSGDIAIELRKNISDAEKKSDTNKNTLSIYGATVTLEDAKSWLNNNPYLAKSEKLLKLADFKTIDGKVDASELAKIASSGGAVVLNGPNSFYLPGIKNDNENKEQPQVNKKPAITEQEKYYKRKNNQQDAELAVEVGGAVLNAIGNIAR